MDDYHSEEAGSGEPSFYYEIPGGLMDKDVVEITGYFFGEKIVVEVLADRYVKNGENIALPLQFTLTNRGQWTAVTYTETIPRQMQSGTTAASENFQIRIIALDSSFEVHLNGIRLCTQKHLVPLPQVSHLLIDGDAEFTGVEFKDLCSENDASVRSNTLNDPNVYDGVAEVTPGFTRLSESRRSSNRKPKPPVLVPTGSLRSKKPLATTREENPVNIQFEQQPVVQSVPMAEHVEATPSVGVAPVSSTPSKTGKRSSFSLTKHRSSLLGGDVRDSKHRSLRDKWKMKKGPKGSHSSGLNDVNECTSASMEDVWMEEGAGREMSADGAGVFVAGAASVPNLHTQTEKEKKRFSLHGSKKSRSTSSPPVEGGDKEKKKHHFAGIHIGKGSKKEKAPKPEKEGKKLGFGKKHGDTSKTSRHGYSKDATLSGPVTSEYDNPEVPGTPISGSQRPASHGSLGDPFAAGSYNVGQAERDFNVKTGTYTRVSGGTSFEALQSDEVYANLTAEDAGKSKPLKLRGESPVIADQIMMSKAQNGGSVEQLTDVNHNVNIPLYMQPINDTSTAAVSSGLAAAAAVAMSTPKTERKKKEKEPKLKGDCAEIADDFMGVSRGMSQDMTTYTENHSVVPLKLTPVEQVSSGLSAASILMTTPRSEHKTKEKEGKLKGDSAEMASNFLGASRGTSQDMTAYTDNQSTVPLQLAQEDPYPGLHAVTTIPMKASNEEHKKKEKEGKLKGTSAEIADNLIGVNRGMSQDFYTYTDSPQLVPLKLSQENLLSINQKGFAPIIGARGSYDLESAPAKPSGTYQQRPDDDWADDIILAQTVSTPSIQHSQPPTGKVEVVEDQVVALAVATGKKDDKKTLKGYSAEIASNLHDLEGVKSHNRFEDNGNPLCGVDGVGVPLVINASNRNAQPMPYAVMKSDRRGSTKSLDSLGGYGVTASYQDNTLYSGAPAGGEQYPKSATLPAATASNSLDAGVAVVMRDKKNKDKHETDEKGRKRDRVSGFFSRIFHRKKKSGTSHSEEECGISEGINTDNEMTERLSYQWSLDKDDDEDTKLVITAKPEETALHASQLRGAKPALEHNAHFRTMCGGGLFSVPMKLTAADIPLDISMAGASFVFGAEPTRRDSLQSWSSLSPGGSRRIYHRSSRHRRDSITSWSSISPGGTRRHRKRSSLNRTGSWSTISPGGSRRIYHHTSCHRPESASSWSSISPGGTRRHRRRDSMHRVDSPSSWSSVTPGGSRHHYRRSNRHRPESVSSWSSISPGGTRRHRRRSDGGYMANIRSEQQIPAYSAFPANGSYADIKKRDSDYQFASQQNLNSPHSSASSIPSLYGRVVIVGQSAGFRTRMQSFRKRMEMPRKAKRPKGASGELNGYDSGSDSSISSIASERLPPSVVKVRGGEYAIFEDAGETIFEERPRNVEDIYAYSKR